MAYLWHKLRSHLPRLRLVPPRWGVVSDVLRTSWRLQLPRRATAIAFGAAVTQLCGILALWATAAQPSPIQGMLYQTATYLSQLLPFLNLSLPAAPPGWGMVAIALLACWWSTTATLARGSHILRHLFPDQRSNQSKLLAWMLGPTRSLLWLLAMGLGTFLIADSQGSSSLGVIVRWSAALGTFCLGYGTVYRLSPRRWLTGHPLLPGALLAATASLINFVLLAKVVARLGPLTGIATTISLLLWLLLLYESSLMMLVGGQLNVSLGKQSPLTRTQRSYFPKATPPSFESFTIRRPPNRLP